MKIHANAPFGPKGRLTMVRRVLEQEWSLTEAAEAAGVSSAAGLPEFQVSPPSDPLSAIRRGRGMVEAREPGYLQRLCPPRPWPANSRIRGCGDMQGFGHFC